MKKGFVFSLDAIFAVFISIAFLLAFVALSKAPISSNIPEASASLIASDIISALDKQDIFDSLNTTLISNTLSQRLPPNLEMSLKLNIYDSNLVFEETRQVNADINTDYYQGKWLFIVGNQSYVNKYVHMAYKVRFI